MPSLEQLFVDAGTSTANQVPSVWLREMSSEDGSHTALSALTGSPFAEKAKKGMR
jgi:hypothetical protein